MGRDIGVAARVGRLLLDADEPDFVPCSDRPRRNEPKNVAQGSRNNLSRFVVAVILATNRRAASSRSTAYRRQGVCLSAQNFAGAAGRPKGGWRTTQVRDPGHATASDAKTTPLRQNR
jgi:hypothetical protein